MHALLRASIFAAFLLAGTPTFSFEVQDNAIDTLGFTVSLAQILVKTDLEYRCDDLDEPSICKLDFELADFYLKQASKALIMAAIAHKGEYRTKLFNAALERHDEGWRRYGDALKKHPLFKESIAEPKPKQEVMKGKM